MKTLIVVAWMLATTAAVPAVAQTEPYETPKYMPAQRSVLDPNYGLPSFGMPGAGMPQQRTMAPEPAAPGAPAGPDTPDLFPAPSDYALPKAPAAARYTTGSMTTGSGTDFAMPGAGTPGDGGYSTAETPLYTTGEGGTTGNDTTSAYDTK